VSYAECIYVEYLHAESCYVECMHTQCLYAVCLNRTCLYALHLALTILSKTVERLGSESLYVSVVALSLNLLLSMSANDT
jgi:hypothetical protein